MWVIISVIALTHWEVTPFVNASIGLALLLLISVLPTRVQVATIRKSVSIALAAFVSASLVVAELSPSTGVENDRLRGLAGNANLFAFFCLLLFALAVVRQQHSRWDILAIVLAIYGLLGSGSRTTAIALVVLTMGAGLLGTRVARRFLVAGTLGGILLYWVAPSIVDVFRVAWGRGFTTRSDAMGAARWVAQESPLLGVGFAQMPDNVASTALSVFVLGGVVASVLFGLVALRLVVDSVAASPVHLVLAVSALLHSLGESWLISTTGPMVAMFAMVAVSVPARPHPPDNPERRPMSSAIPLPRDSEREKAMGLSVARLGRGRSQGTRSGMGRPSRAK